MDAPIRDVCLFPRVVCSVAHACWPVHHALLLPRWEKGDRFINETMMRCDASPKARPTWPGWPVSFPSPIGRGGPKPGAALGPTLPLRAPVGGRSGRSEVSAAWSLF